MNDEDLSPGWEAIDQALKPIYGDAEPQHWGTLVRYWMGGPDPLDGVSAYRRDDPVPHWHFISYGMSELYQKETDNPDVSGWGFEFTFRLAREADETQAPIWAVSFLQNLARYVYETGNVFEAGHHMNLNGPISLANPETLIRAVAFAHDPELPEIQTPNGRMHFLQIVGLTLDELDALVGWNTRSFLDVAAESLPLLVTDLERASVLSVPGIAAKVADGTQAEGSSTTGFFVDVISWRPLPDQSGFEITIGANGLLRWGALFLSRLNHGRPMMVWGREQSLAFEPGETPRTEADENAVLVMTLTPELVADFKSRLKPERGRYEFSAGSRIVFNVVPSEIKDRDGNVVEVIG